jgi:3-oxoacyl-(acyl-carrier-protein) synthase
MLDHVQISRDQTNVQRRCNDGVGIQVALSNSFGFGGTNASLCFKKAT